MDAWLQRWVAQDARSMRVAGHRLRGGRCFRKGFARNAMVAFDEVFLFLNAGLQDLTLVPL